MGAGSCRSFWENACLCKNRLGASWFVLPGHLILSLSSLRKLYAELCQGIVDVAISSVFPLNDTGQKTNQPSSIFIKLWWQQECLCCAQGEIASLGSAQFSGFSQYHAKKWDRHLISWKIMGKNQQNRYPHRAAMIQSCSDNSACIH